jgi:NADH dehydrogenase FAD-containing subunit
MPPFPPVSHREFYDVVVLGAGYAGLMAALRLGQRRLGLRVALINVEEQFVERIRVQESMIAPVKPRIPSLSTYIARRSIDFLRARVISLDMSRRRVHIDVGGVARNVEFGQAIYALGSQVDTVQIQGAAEHSFRLDPGAGPRSAAALRTALHKATPPTTRVLAIGGGALSIEAAGEVKSTWPQMSVALISASRAGDFCNAKVEAVLRRDLSRLGVRLIDHQSITEVTATDVVTVNGLRFPFDICILAAGMRAPSIAKEAGIEVDAQNRVVVGPDLRSISHPFILAAGDSGHPNAPTGAPYRLSALTAAVSGAYAAEQAIARGVGKRIRPFSFSTFAQAVAIGRFAALFPLDANDNPILFVMGGRTARRVRDVLVWLVLYFISLERLLPGVQSWPGRRRAERPAPDIARRMSDVQMDADR